MRLNALWIVLATAALLFVAGCSDEEVDVAESQRSAIENYLKTSHDPRLIDVSDVPNAMTPNPAFYERLEYNTYRYIATYYEPERNARAVVKQGDEVSLTYMACVFSSGKPSLSDVYATNDASVIAQLREAGLNTNYWQSEPLKVKIGHTNIIKGVELSLIGCHEGDVVEAYLTLDAAYGDDVVGVVAEESSVVWFYIIDSITTQN